MTGYDKIFYRIVMVLLLSPSIVYSQKPSVETLSNKKNILIGEQIKVNVKTIFPLHSTITGYSLGIPDSIPHFDIIDIGKADTIDYKDDAKAIGVDYGSDEVTPYVVQSDRAFEERQAIIENTNEYFTRFDAAIASGSLVACTCVERIRVEG